MGISAVRDSKHAYYLDRLGEQRSGFVRQQAGAAGQTQSGYWGRHRAVLRSGNRTVESLE